MTASSPKAEPEFPSEQAVEAYLRAHPDFFERHLALLALLRLPHPVSGSVSLIERQVTLLRDRHRQLEQHMGDLVERARDNERVGEHLHRLACTLMHAEGPDAVLALTQDALRDEMKAELVSIRLIGPEHDDLHRLREADLAHFDELFVRGRAQCGRLPRAMLAVMFGDEASAVGSAILMPLVAEGGGRTGVLALGSRSAERFQPDMGTYFVTHLGELLAEAIRCHAGRRCAGE
ncbi:DUF484 family protein [Thioalkalivibrio paradoxus]|uniref:Phytochrome sensor protein n=1 Tax=Thioalkalivibrio paradoxus ARh 1 TaxID=713585 RepID=W0DF64_9GAMM|nr:DUF484 family protein [Thioalkalivibrio paradoxus]AHE97006.1 phytochrome sensor protein [Thioalkalivibrio paradoxus ARh 1]